MDCNNCIESLGAFIDGELTAEEQTRVEAHLAECADCKRLCAELRELAKLVGELEEPVPEGFRESWQKKLAEQQKPVGVNTRVFGSIAAAVLVVALVIGLYPVIIAPKTASYAAEADVVAGSAPEALPADFAGAGDLAETGEAAEAAEAAEATTEEIAPAAIAPDFAAADSAAADSAAADGAAADSAAADFAEPESAEEPLLMAPPNGKARSLAAPEDATAPAMVAAPEASSESAASEPASAVVPEAAVPKLAFAAPEAAENTQSGSGAQTDKSAENNEALFTAKADSLLEAAPASADSAATTAGAADSGALASHQPDWITQAAQGRPLDFTGRITIYTNGAAIEQVRKDWMALLDKYGFVVPQHMYVEEAEKLQTDMQALGYTMFFDATYTDMPFEVVILEE